MKFNLLLCSSLLLLAPITQAAVVVIVGTPGDSQLSKPTGPSPNLGGLLINFDNLTTPVSCQEAFVGCPVFSPSTYAAQGVTSISSPDGLLVAPFSTQSGPNELFDNSNNGTANITITLASGTDGIGIGIADSDPVSITLQALGLNGVLLGPAFVENLATTESQVNTGNGYYVVEDNTPGIFGLQITQTVANGNFSGLAIDDLQVAPEPSSFLLLAAGAIILGSFFLLKRA